MHSSALASGNPHFTIFGFEIYYYAVIIVAGIILATIVVALLFKRRNIPVDWTLDLLLCILPLGIIGARTFYVVTDPSTDISEWLTGFRDGGLSIIGGVCGGALGVVLFQLFARCRLSASRRNTCAGDRPLGKLRQSGSVRAGNYKRGSAMVPPRRTFV